MTRDKTSVKLLVRLLEDGKLTLVYERDVFPLPFVPSVGMRFEKSRGSAFQTDDGEQLALEVERVIYDLDEQVLVCVCTVTARIGGQRAFWDELEVTELGGRERYFRGM